MTPDLQALLELWRVRMDAYRYMHETDGVMLQIMDAIMKDQIRQYQKQGFWWHIREAFISLTLKP